MKNEKQLASDLLALVKASQSSYKVVGNNLVITSNGIDFTIPMFLGSTTSENVLRSR